MSVEPSFTEKSWIFIEKILTSVLTYRLNYSYQTFIITGIVQFILLCYTG